jgi:hypothetical protein
VDDQRPAGTVALALDLDALRERTHVQILIQEAAALASLALFIAMIAFEDAPCLQRGHLHVAQRNTD